MFDKFRYGLMGLLVAAALVAGCGGESSEEAPAESATTPEEYRAELMTFFENLQAEAVAAAPEGGGGNSPEAAAQQLAALEGALQSGTADLEAIEPPEGAEAPHDQLVAAIQSFGDATAQASDAIESGEEPQTVLSEYGQATAAFQQQLMELGPAFEEAGVDLGGGAPPPEAAPPPQGGVPPQGQAPPGGAAPPPQGQAPPGGAAPPPQGE